MAAEKFVFFSYIGLVNCKSGVVCVCVCVCECECGSISAFSVGLP